MVIAARKGSNNSTDTNRPSRILFIAVATLLIVIFLLSIVTWIIGHSSLFSPKSSVLEYHHQLRTTSTSTNSIMGYTKEVIKEGNGDKPGRGQYVTVHCTGYGKDGDLSQKFWSTKDPGGEPFTFRVGMGEVIKGWDEAVLTMSIGEIARVHCSPDYAYGSSGFPAWGIQPNSQLSFEIEVLKYSFTAN